MDNKSAIEVPVDETLALLAQGDNWIQGSGNNSDGGMCLHQGIRACERQAGDAFLIEQVAAFQGWGTSFNDDWSTKFDDVKQRLVEHREIFPHELEETFGPNWRLVVQFVRRASSLTHKEIEDLAAAGAAARAAARDAARATAGDLAAAWDAARAAARAAARDAARDAARAAARAAAGDAAAAAARAIVVHDLVGNHGLEQHHIDTLTSVWREAIGDPLKLR